MLTHDLSSLCAAVCILAAEPTAEAAMIEESLPIPLPEPTPPPPALQCVSGEYLGITSEEPACITCPLVQMSLVSYTSPTKVYTSAAVVPLAATPVNATSVLECVTDFQAFQSMSTLPFMSALVAPAQAVTDVKGCVQACRDDIDCAAVHYDMSVSSNACQLWKPPASTDPTGATAA